MGSPGCALNAAPGSVRDAGDDMLARRFVNRTFAAGRALPTTVCVRACSTEGTGPVAKPPAFDAKVGVLKRKDGSL